jgi:glycogen debranching enzyme
MSADTISILEGNTFVVSDRRGDIDALPTDTHGLFHLDTRFLSRWMLTVDGKRPSSLSTDDQQYMSAQFFLVPGTGTVYVDSELSIVRKRAVGDGFHEDLEILNHGKEPRDLTVQIEAGCDFADLFEVKDALAKKGQFYKKVEKNKLILGYKRDRFVRETWIVSSQPAEVDEKGFTFKVHVDPHGSWSTHLEVVVAFDGMDRRTHTKYSRGDEKAHPVGTSLDKWMSDAPKLTCSWRALEETYHRSLVDLAALRFFPKLAQGDALPAAGLPWFMAVFGRDSIFTSLQALPYAPDLARTTLHLLSLWQGTNRDDFRDEEPGKILHEMRWGEMTAFEERPHSPYYGAADSTPLYLVLLDETVRWTGDVELARSLEKNARYALEWIDKWGDRDGDGYVEYERRMKTGLDNQCWKDSWNSILFSDGSIAPLPRATCEIQGYVYDAKMRCARLAREVWGDPKFAEKLEQEAAELKKRFNSDFWIDDRQFFALALDGHKRQVDSLTSNIGHLLWSGIVDDDKIDICVKHLMGPKLFTGWGIRTMAEGEGGYNPIGYHVGTVWPHDCSFIAAGLRKAGYAREAAQLSLGILQAAIYFRGRLPEAFAGYPRSMTEFPVEYPTACSPQAWATGAPLLHLTTMLGLEPVHGRLLVDPAIPTEIERLELLGVPGAWGRADAFGRGRVEVSRERRTRERKGGEARPQAPVDLEHAPAAGHA